MTTEVRVPRADIPPSRSVSPDMFTDLSGECAFSIDGADLVIAFAVDLSQEVADKVRLRLVCRDDGEATKVLEVTEAVAQCAPPETPPTTDAERIAALEQQVAALMAAIPHLADLVVGSRLPQL